MAEMGQGYGSECHLLRYLGRHRAALDAAVVSATGADRVAWLDYPFDAGRTWGDGEWKGLDFLPPDSAARRAFADAWPTRGNPPNWDAVGRIERNGVAEWLLVEAKGDVEELASSCGAKAEGGRPRIAATLERTKADLGVDPARDWLAGYYQFANRIAVLHLLIASGEPARLLFLYFTGDRNRGGTCPADEAGWSEALAAQDRHIGLPRRNPLAPLIHKVFLPANPGVVGPAPLVADLMADAIGAIDSGVSGLATNPRHMKDFGRDGNRG